MPVRNGGAAPFVTGDTGEASPDRRYVPVGGAESPLPEVRSDWVAIFPLGEKEVKPESRPCAGE